MTGLYWAITFCFLLVGIVWAVCFKRKALAAGWSLIALLCLLDIAAGFRALLSGSGYPLGIWGQIAPFGAWAWQLDGLGAYFLALLGVLGFLVSVYNAAQAAKGNETYGTWALVSAAVQYFFTNVLLAAHNALPLLIAWEGMSITAFCYVLTNHTDRKTRRSAYLTIVFSEIGFLALVIALLLPEHGNLSMDFSILAANLRGSSPGVQLAVAILAFIGFGVKSGFIPVQFWLPRAYLSVPGSLGALLAGGLVNLGVFGVLRVYFNWFSARPVPDGFAAALLLIGASGVFLGALYAAILRDLKHILGYSSIENTSFMLLDIGLMLLFQNHGLKMFAGLAFTALLFLMVSHGLAKALAFLDVGEIEKAAGTTNLDRLGGLHRKLPATGRTFLVACLSLATVAPFSGFTAEWLGLQSMFQIVRILPPVEKAACTLSVILAAMGSALAFTAFLRAYTHTFTGYSRLGEPVFRGIKERLPAVARAALAVLAGLCALVGFFPTLPLSLLAPMENRFFPGIINAMVPDVFRHAAAADLLPKLGGRLFSFLPLPGPEIEPAADAASIAPMYLAFWFPAIACLVWIGVKALRRPYPARKVRAWFGGAPGFGPDSQYTATAFSNVYRMLCGSLLGFRVVRENPGGTVSVPASIQVRTWTRQVLSMSPYEKILTGIRKKAKPVSRIQHGHLFGYVAYILLYLLLMLLLVILISG